MQNSALLLIAAFALLVPTSAFAQCTIEGMDYDEGRLFTSCKICDSARSATEWSDVICEPDLAIDLRCQVVACTENKGCVAKQLPEHTRCVVPACSNGEITQTECTAAGACTDDRVKSCGGFACLDAFSCTTQCVDNTDCESPATCNGQVCEMETASEDMGNDTSVQDMGNDTSEKVDASTMDATKDLDEEDVSEPDNNAPVSSGGGCATNNGGGSWFGLVLFGFFATLRRSKKQA